VALSNDPHRTPMGVPYRSPLGVKTRIAPKIIIMVVCNEWHSLATLTALGAQTQHDGVDSVYGTEPAAGGDAIWASDYTDYLAHRANMTKNYINVLAVSLGGVWSASSQITAIGDPAVAAFQSAAGFAAAPIFQTAGSYVANWQLLNQKDLAFFQTLFDPADQTPTYSWSSGTSLYQDTMELHVLLDTSSSMVPSEDVARWDAVHPFALWTTSGYYYPADPNWGVNGLYLGDGWDDYVSYLSGLGVTTTVAEFGDERWLDAVNTKLATFHN